MLILIVVLMVRCSQRSEEPAPQEDPAPQTLEPAKTTETAEPDTEVETNTGEPAPQPFTGEPVIEDPVAAMKLPQIAFFADNGGGEPYVPITSFSSEWASGKEIGSFGVIPDIQVSGKRNYGTLWKAAYESFSGLQKCKLGYTLKFETYTGVSFTIDLLSPTDASGSFEPFLKIFLYDDYTHAGYWYTHLDENNFTSDSLITSVQLIGGENADEITSITLSAYLYSPTGMRTEPITISPTKKTAG